MYRFHLQCFGRTHNLKDEGGTVLRRGGNKLRNCTEQQARRAGSSTRKQVSNQHNLSALGHFQRVKANSHMPCRDHAVPLPCRAALIHTCHATPLPFSDSAVSFVKVRVVADSSLSFSRARLVNRSQVVLRYAYTYHADPLIRLIN
jgi:hypothetical protein